MRIRSNSSWMLFPVLIAAAIAVTPCCAGTKDFHQVYPLQRGGSFELQNVNGPVEVQGWDRDTIEIDAIKVGREKEADLDRVTIEVSARPDDVSVITRYPQDEGVEVAVQYRVRVPRGARVEHVGTVNGTLKIASVDRIEDLHTVNGNIEVYEGGGNLHARTTNGDVHLELSRILGDKGTSAETTNGSVLLAVPQDTQADLEARSLNGSFFSELPFAREASMLPRQTRGKLGKGGAPIRLNTVNGGIQLMILRPTV
ncbi:MAG TPA: DUF4097 family beta strand repeat-containing protein [Candidatus Acidoferrum sp.]|nr:DUF4097 family beta strand repeat-containing protein [Candidatus Acidoferrum sp.]